MKKNLITALKKLVTSFGGSAESNNAVDLVDEFANNINSSKFPPTTNLRLMVLSISNNLPVFQTVSTSTLNNFVKDVQNGKVPVINVESGSGTNMYCFVPRVSGTSQISLKIKAVIPYATGVPGISTLTLQNIWGVSISITKQSNTDATLTINTEWTKTF